MVLNTVCVNSSTITTLFIKKWKDLFVKRSVNISFFFSQVGKELRLKKKAVEALRSAFMIESIRENNFKPAVLLIFCPRKQGSPLTGQLQFSYREQTGDYLQRPQTERFLNGKFNLLMGKKKRKRNKKLN